MFAKLFEQIYDSSIADNWKTRVVFQDMLVLADREGFVDKTPEALSRRTRIPLAMIKGAIKELESPDPRSRSPEEGGRRIVKIDEHRDWGWRIVNYETYRHMKDEFDRTEYMKRYMRKRRLEDPLNQVKHEFNKVNTLTKDTSTSISASVPNGTTSQAEQVYAAYPKKVARPVAIRSIIKVLSKHEFSMVYAATKRFAEAWSGASTQEMSFCPYPATWFNQERFNDPPETWGPRHNETPAHKVYHGPNL